MHNARDQTIIWQTFIHIPNETTGTVFIIYFVFPHTYEPPSQIPWIFFKKKYLLCFVRAKVEERWTYVERVLLLCGSEEKYFKSFVKRHRVQKAISVVHISKSKRFIFIYFFSLSIVWKNICYIICLTNKKMRWNKHKNIRIKSQFKFYLGL